MDNKAYLDEIAVKGKRKGNSGPILSPAVIKLIIVAVFAVIALAVVGGIISNKNQETVQLYEAIYQRMYLLADDESPFIEFQNSLYSSDLRAYNISVVSSLQSTMSTLASASTGAGFNADSISSKVEGEQRAVLDEFIAKMEEAKLLGEGDVTFAAEASYQLSSLIAMEQEARSKVTDANFAQALDDSIRDLTALEKNYHNWTAKQK